MSVDNNLNDDIILMSVDDTNVIDIGVHDMAWYEC